ncbi:hypothetical protein ADEAN_000652500 [Angomonas deanei]|uniref:Uncharacterized protein n=1 Tax=Angomonas deanei TaxID=59799 RepID=A0A7G2CLA7_9TRYP|nr:hypothetical protein ADEAN_000652500 [Angomonas deanei]
MSHPHKENTNRSKVRKRIESPVVVTKRPKREGQPSLEPRPDNAPNAWQYTSNSRCITHGVLECKTCASKMDPQERKQRIDMINLTTPYERAKLEKLLFEVQNKEVKKRLAIIAEYDHFVSSIVEFRDTLASITEEERESRSGIVRQNKRLRRAYLRAFEVETNVPRLLRVRARSPEHYLVLREQGPSVTAHLL